MTERLGIVLLEELFHHRYLRQLIAPTLLTPVAGKIFLTFLVWRRSLPAFYDHLAQVALTCVMSFRVGSVPKLSFMAAALRPHYSRVGSYYPFHACRREDSARLIREAGVVLVNRTLSAGLSLRRKMSRLLLAGP